MQNHHLYAAKQCQQIDRIAIEQFGLAGYTLMQRAAEAILTECLARYPAAQHWLVICGSGNNAGDGYIVARLAKARGKQVRVLALRDVRALSGDARQAAEDWLAAGGSVEIFDEAVEIDLGSPELVVDALLGTGLARSVSGLYAELINAVNALPSAVVAVDIPSGLNADTGCVMGACIQADCTVTLIANKPGLYTADGPDYCGAVEFADLAVPEAVFAGLDYGLLIHDFKIRNYLRARKRNSHKGSYGHVFALGGCAGMAGAIRLAGEAALRTGAGKVTLVGAADSVALAVVSRPELMSCAVDDEIDLRPVLNAADVLAVGPGLGQGKTAERLMSAAMSAGKTMVVDADGLNYLADHPQPSEAWILTPHPAEAARLLGSQVAEVQRDRLSAARCLALSFNAVVVLKGCGSIIAEPSGRYALCALGHPGMASAGMGDVLTGIIAALLGQGLDPFSAAQAGVAAHAAAAECCVANGRVLQRGMLASDLLIRLPEILN